ncbi:hypothetical protein H4R35_006639 [Dimargaris xerosporica]|nr:hypothetical protein H4R35_006639 [Dimargaris xerosporica]
MPCYQVLRCFDAQCGTFQSHQAKKAKRWNCTVCNQRQSLRRVYFESENPAECRKVVQTLNLRRGEQQDHSTAQRPQDRHGFSPTHCHTNDTAVAPQATGTLVGPPAPSGAGADKDISASRWSRFVDESDGEPPAPIPTPVVPQSNATQSTSLATSATSSKTAAPTRSQCPPNSSPSSSRPTIASTLPATSQASLISSLKSLNKFRASPPTSASAGTSTQALPAIGASPLAQGQASSKWGQYHGDSQSSDSDSSEG